LPTLAPRRDRALSVAMATVRKGWGLSVDPPRRSRSGMELRNGVYTSQTRKRDAEDIEQLAKKLLSETDPEAICRGLEKIKRIARDLAKHV
jgi:hypothetical protein